MSDTLKVQFYGPKPLDGAVEAMPHIKSLLREITREVCGDADAINWVWQDLRVICDGCEMTRPPDHPDWLNDGMYDYCFACAHERLMGCFPG